MEEKKEKEKSGQAGIEIGWQEAGLFTGGPLGVDCLFPAFFFCFVLFLMIC